MKKLLLPLTITGALLVGACGNDEAQKKDDSKKSESVEKKKEASKKSESEKDTAKKDNKSTEQTEQVTTEEPNTQEQQSQEVAQQEQPTEQPVQQEPTEQEKTEANKEWAKENIKGGTDAGMLDPSVMADGYYSNDQLDPDTGLPKDDAVPHKVGENVETTEEPSEWVKGQDEWNNASEAERVEIQKRHAKESGVEYDPKDFEVD